MDSLSIEEKAYVEKVILLGQERVVATLNTTESTFQ